MFLHVKITCNQWSFSPIFIDVGCMNFFIKTLIIMSISSNIYRPNVCDPLCSYISLINNSIDLMTPYWFTLSIMYANIWINLSRINLTHSTDRVISLFDAKLHHVAYKKSLMRTSCGGLPCTHYLSFMGDS